MAPAMEGSRQTAGRRRSVEACAERPGAGGLGRRGRAPRLAVGAALLCSATAALRAAFAAPSAGDGPRLRGAGPATRLAAERGLPLGAAAEHMERTGPSDDEAWHGQAWSAVKACASALAVCAALLGPPRLAGGPLAGASLVAGPEAAAARGQSSYASGSKVNKDPISLLQLALPLEETLGEKKVERLRTAQRLVEEVGGNIKVRLWDKAYGEVNDAGEVLKQSKKALLELVPGPKRTAAEGYMTALDGELINLKRLVVKGQDTERATVKDKEVADAATAQFLKCQDLIGKVEESLVPVGYSAPLPKWMPKNLPRLDGRATIEMTLKRPEGSQEKKYDIDNTIYEEAKLRIVLDGWSMPITAGNFVDLVDKGYYTNGPLQRADGFIIQFGDSGDANGNGYKENGKVRTIPLEVALKGQKEALYSETLDEAGRIGEQVRIPFQVDGTLALARAEFENDSASAQIFMFLFESDMTPAGKNLLDGRYASFGYTIEGGEFLRQLKERDIIVSAKVVDGLDRLVRPVPA